MKMISLLRESYYNLNKLQRTVMIGLLLFFAVALFVLMLIAHISSSRTIMIYLSAGELETKYLINSNELSSINPKKINLSKMNVLLYVGGTVNWHNDFEDSKNGIYLLTKDGFKKVKSEDTISMGESDTLSSFLNYGFKEYKASKYDLIFLGNSNGLNSVITDELFDNDSLSLEEVKIALENSPFHNKQKLETITFYTSFNSTIEIASILKDYAKYMIASQNVSYVRKDCSILSFINYLKAYDDGFTYGKRIIKEYQSNMNKMISNNDYMYTYSIIDLNIIDQLEKEFNLYISSIDVNRYYKNIVNSRSQLYEYGTHLDKSYYDLVDLYDFIYHIKDYSSMKTNKLLNLINKSVKYNFTNHKTSHGISIYFPFHTSVEDRNKYLELYKQFNSFNNYNSFLETFTSLQSKTDNYDFSLNKNEIITSKKDKLISVNLTDEQLKNYLDSSFEIFIKDKELDEYYRLIIHSDDVEQDNNQLTAKIDNILMLDDINEGVLLTTYYDKKYPNKWLIDSMSLSLKDYSQLDDKDVYGHYVNIALRNDKNLFISSIKLKSNGSLISRVIFEGNQYSDYVYPITYYKILDENGTFLDDSKWERDIFARFVEGDFNKISFKRLNTLDDNDYYGVFIVRDIYNNTYYSRFVPIKDM